MDIRKFSVTDVLLLVGLLILVLCAAWGVSFSQSCKGDKCFGMIVPIGAWLVVFCIQGIAIIADVFIRVRAKKTYALRALGWFLVSLVTGALPLLYFL